jgi:hypothetical protein
MTIDTQLGPADARTFEAVARPFAAAHSGQCSTCHEPFSEGDMITRAAEGWSHADCPEEKPVGAVCPRCHTAASLSGECLC